MGQCTLSTQGDFDRTGIEVGVGGTFGVLSTSDEAKSPTLLGGGFRFHVDYASSNYKEMLWPDCSHTDEYFSSAWRVSTNYTAVFADRGSAHMLDVRLGGQIAILLPFPEFQVGFAYIHARHDAAANSDTLGVRLGARMVFPLASKVKSYIPRIVVEGGAVMGGRLSDSVFVVFADATLGLYVPFW